MRKRVSRRWRRFGAPETAPSWRCIRWSATFSIGFRPGTAQREMDRHTVIHDWYWRNVLQAALTDLRLAQGDLPRAAEEGEAFLRVACATPERTWQALAWEANARIALAASELERARDCIT